MVAMHGQLGRRSSSRLQMLTIEEYRQRRDSHGLSQQIAVALADRHSGNGSTLDPTS